MLPLTGCNKEEVKFEGTYEAYSVESNNKELKCPITAEAWGASLEDTGIEEFCSSKYVFADGTATVTYKVNNVTKTRTEVYRFADDSLYFVDEQDDSTVWGKVATYKDGKLTFGIESTNHMVYKKK